MVKPSKPAINIVDKKLSIATESKAKQRQIDQNNHNQENQYINQDVIEKSKEFSETTGNPSHLGHVFNLRDPRYSQEQQSATLNHGKGLIKGKVKRNHQLKEFQGEQIKEETNQVSSKLNKG